MPLATETKGTPDRDAVLDMLADTMAALQERIDAAEPEADDDEELHLKRVHELGYLANQYRKLQRDTDLDEMSAELELVKAAAGAGGD